MACYFIDGIAPVTTPATFGRLNLQESTNIQDTCVMHGSLNTITTVEMNGAVVGHSSIVATMSLVRKGVEVPDRHPATGTPCRIINKLKDEEMARKEQGRLVFARADSFLGQF